MVLVYFSEFCGELLMIACDAMNAPKVHQFLSNCLIGTRDMLGTTSDEGHHMS